VTADVLTIPTNGTQPPLPILDGAAVPACRLLRSRLQDAVEDHRRELVGDRLGRQRPAGAVPLVHPGGHAHDPEDRDPRIGSTADIGHWVRSGLDPLECLKILKGRIIATHLKDLNEKSASAHDVPYGNGVSNIPGILTELKRQGFVGNVSVEYEFNWDNNAYDAAQCIGFVRGWAVNNTGSGL